MMLQRYWKAILVSEADPETNEKAMSKMVLYISPRYYVHIQDVSTAKDVWAKLNVTYEDSGLSRRCGLLKKLTTIQLINCANISGYQIGFNLTE